MKYRHELRNDQWIVEQVFPSKKDGFFVEAGATNGIGGSSTYVLEKVFNWRGICVEPIPWQFERIKEYRNAKADNRALWSQSGEQLEFTIFPNRTGRSGLSDVNKNITEMRNESEEEKVVVVETVTLSELLDDHAAPTVIDYLCLDVEGAEREVLKTFDFSGRYTIKAVSIEGHSCDDLMLEANYEPVRNPFTDVEFETYWLHRSHVKAA